MERYETGYHLLKAGIVSGHDSTTESAVTKLMFLLGHGYSPDEVRRRMNESMAGEISIDLSKWYSGGLRIRFSEQMPTEYEKNASTPFGQLSVWQVYSEFFAKSQSNTSSYYLRQRPEAKTDSLCHLAAVSAKGQSRRKDTGKSFKARLSFQETKPLSTGS